MDTSKLTAIFIPTYGRPEKLQAVYDNVAASLTKPIGAIYFICEPHDTASREAVRNLKQQTVLPAFLLVNQQRPCYSDAVNFAYGVTKEPYFFVGSDDLDFRPGWFEACIAKMEGKVCVVGTNDLLDRQVLAGQQATHFLVKRSYIDQRSGTIDGGFNRVFYPYHHYACDTEFIDVAKHRGVFAPCLEAVVAHRHHINHQATFDATYKKNMQHIKEDRAMYQQRRALWQK